MQEGVDNLFFSGRVLSMKPSNERRDYDYAQHVGRLCHDVDDGEDKHFYLIIDCFEPQYDVVGLRYRYFIMQDDGQDTDIMDCPVSWFHESVVFTWIENGEVKREVIRDP